MTVLNNEYANRLREALATMRHGAVKNYVLPGLTSHLVGGKDHGMVRMFSADRDTEGLITPHSHRFDLTCLVLSGTVTNTLYLKHPDGDEYAIGLLEKGRLGKYTIRRDAERVRFGRSRNSYGLGMVYAMKANDIHSIHFAKGTEVLFLEGPSKEESRTMFLEPVVEGQAIPTFKTEDWMFRRG